MVLEFTHRTIKYSGVLMAEMEKSKPFNLIRIMPSEGDNIDKSNIVYRTDIFCAVNFYYGGFFYGKNKRKIL